MNLLVWNIQQGGRNRRRHIADSINGHSPDIVALIEFIPSTAGPLSQSLRDSGFEHSICTTPNGFDHTICVLSKTPISTRPSGITTLDNSGLWLEITVPAHRFSFGVVHVPTKSPKMKEFLNALIRVGSLKAQGPFLFVGDFNAGVKPADGILNNAGVAGFPALLKTGFTDAWRHIHGDLIEYTYTQNGKSYRIDHALASSVLLPRIRNCCYSHLEREDGASDHSALRIEIGDREAHP